MVLLQFKASVTVPDSDGPERYDITLVYRSLFSVLISLVILDACFLLYLYDMLWVGKGRDYTSSNIVLSWQYYFIKISLMD